VIASPDVETCKRCGGSLKSREDLARALRHVRRDAEAAVSEHEPTQDPVQRLEAELDYVEVAIDQIAGELEGVCSECWEPVD
jgi:hypothetical protein